MDRPTPAVLRCIEKIHILEVGWRMTRGLLHATSDRPSPGNVSYQPTRAHAG